MPKIGKFMRLGSQAQLASFGTLLHGLGPNKASGIDGISSRVLKLSAAVISPSLTSIFNQSILTGIFPNDWKIARITPIFKSEAKDEMTNYRPISVISVVAKIAEKLIYNQIYNYNLLQTPNTDLDHFTQLLQHYWT